MMTDFLPPFDSTKLFNIGGEALRFDLHLLQDQDLHNALSAQIQSFGGRILTLDEEENLKKPIFMLFDVTSHDVQQLNESASNLAHICLEWEWVLACNKQQRFLGPLENDWARHRFYPHQNAAASSSATSSTRCTQSTSPNLSPLPTTGDLIVKSNRLGSMSSMNISSSSSISQNRMNSGSHGPTASAVKRRRSKSPQLVSRDSNHPSGQLKRRKTSTKGASPLKEAMEASAARVRRAASPSLRPPAPPKMIRKNEWFGHDFTAEDRAFMVKYLDYFCTKYEEPDFKALFKELGIAAPHHKASTWGKYFDKNESAFASEIPSLRKLYMTPEASDEGEQQSSDKTRVSSTSRHPAWVPKEKFKPADATDVAPSEGERKALIKFLAEAPEGVELPELLQNFAHIHPGHSWRIWQKLIRQNQDSLDRAIAKRRAKNARVSSQS
ncbi:hypothetical protein FRB97_000814 [Tulasnella sp. 331]|nr:hypothetical protein FRB97_000814 [Tulasnella sp. 331]KAG8890295.1 hypothetical protein FRB98_009362 [Tulasnella sp. 332]